MGRADRRMGVPREFPRSEKARDLVVPPLRPVESSPYVFSASWAPIERAAAITRAWLASGGLARRELPPELSAHEHEV